MTRNTLSKLFCPVLRVIREIARPNSFSRSVLAAAVLTSGCVTRDDPLDYPHDEPVQFYRDHAEPILLGIEDRKLQLEASAVDRPA